MKKSSLIHYLQTNDIKREGCGWIRWKEGDKFVLIRGYINLEYNIFCKDPFIKEIDDIMPLSVIDLCNLIGYNVIQSARLLKELQVLTFEHNHRTEFLISYVDNGTNSPQSKMLFVNPHILYNGSNFQKVEVLVAFCRVDSGKDARHWADSCKFQ